jgi:hypothetical protein
MKCPPPEGEDVSGDGAGEFSVCLIPSFMCLWVGFSAAAMATVSAEIDFGTISDSIL